MLNFYLPDLYTNAALICFLSDLMKHIPQWFYDDVRIGAAYGAFPGSIWNGGRVVLGMSKKSEMESIIKEYNDRDIAVRYTFTNPLIEEKHLGDTYCNLCLERANNGKNEVIVNSPILEEYLRKNYPGMKLISSTTKCMDDMQKVKEELKKDYFLVVTDSSWNNTDELFMMEPKEKIEVIVNHYCEDHCPRRRGHYHAIGKAQLEYADLEFPDCPYTARSFFQIMENHSFITNELIHGKYREAGFKHFKVDGRAHAARNVVESFLYYLAKPEYIDQVRLIVYKEIYKL